jgi:hypothetical protein
MRGLAVPDEKRTWTCNVNVSESVDVGGPNWPFRTYADLLRDGLARIGADIADLVFWFEAIDLIDLSELDALRLGVVDRVNQEILAELHADHARSEHDETILKLANSVGDAIARDPRRAEAWLRSDPSSDLLRRPPSPSRGEGNGVLTRPLRPLPWRSGSQQGGES